MTQARGPRPGTADPGGEVRVGVYVRRSTDDEHQPYSIEAQDIRLTAYIDSQPSWRQAARFADDASGASTHRPGLQRALAAARAGVIDVLLVYRVDRLTRSLRDLVTLLDDLDRAGVVFRSATEPFDTATAMGRMLVQMLGMFAQFERDTIIDRVIAGMERKAAAGKWKGGRRPFGYRVDPATSTLVPDAGEAAVVRLIFDAYTRNRLGGKAVAGVLNDRGHRTTTGGPWSAHQVLRVLSSRAYLGELTFRGITAAGCHPAIVDEKTFAEAQRILAARGEDHSRRAANASDYLLTGLMRCPDCGKAMIGTRAHGRSRVYLYYTCFTRARYDSGRCHASRLDADAVEHAVVTALASFYRDQDDLIADAIAAAQASHAATHEGKSAELAATEHELARTGAAINRYLTAFENGTLDPEDLAGRLAQLKVRSAQLRARRDELAAQIAAVPIAPSAAALRQVADHIGDIVESGSHSQRKALIEVLIAQINITAPDRIVPVFRIPQPASDQPEPSAGPATAHRGAAEDPVRAMTNLVGQLLIVLLLVSFVSFLLENLLPGNLAIDILGPAATKAGIIQIDHQLHLDQPLVVRYLDWLGGVLHGNLGESYHTGQPVSQALAQRLPVTAELLVLSQVISLAIAVPLGILSALRPGGRLDKVSGAGAFGFLAFPPFVLATLFVLVFAVRLRIFPATGYVPFTQAPLANLRDMLLPSLTLALGTTAIYIRVLRAEMISTLQENFIIMARSKGLPTRHILLRHALRPSSFALVTVAGLNVGGLIGGAFLIELVFSLPGIGLLTLNSVYDHDFLVIQGVVLVVATVYVLVNFLVDLLYLVIDPRTRRVGTAR